VAVRIKMTTTKKYEMKEQLVELTF